jgi:hypothetical protein
MSALPSKADIPQRELLMAELSKFKPVAFISVNLEARRYGFASIPMVRHRWLSIHHPPEAQCR